MDPIAQGLLGRLDTMVQVVARRRGLALAAPGRLAPAEIRTLALAAGLPIGQDGAVGLLTDLAVAVGLVRTRGLRLEATPLWSAWRTLDPAPRAGLVYAAWCHRLPWERHLGPTAAVRALFAARLRILSLLFDLPAGVDVDLGELGAMAARWLEVPPGPCLSGALTSAFLEPLVSLAAAELDPSSPQPARLLRLGPPARLVIGSALIAAGAEVALPSTAGN